VRRALWAALRQRLTANSRPAHLGPARRQAALPPAPPAGQPPLLVPKENYRVKCMSMGFFTEVGAGQGALGWSTPLARLAASWLGSMPAACSTL
jgi:hypothetical protein